MIIGASSQAARVRAAMQMVEDHPGMRLEHDWLRAIEEHGTGIPVSRAEREEYGVADLEAIEDCDVLWFLAPGPGVATNAFVELGFAIGLRIMGLMLVASGPREGLLYDWALNVWVSDDDTAFAGIAARAGADS